jgi:NAD(P)-dependent dehydrogenase (short-subunit alcohol dehydrogenase family)
MNILNGKTILITGATNGIGKVAALELAKLGPTIAIVGRNPRKTEQTVSEIVAQSGNQAITGLIADLSSMAEVRRLADTFTRQFQSLHVLINDAGGIFASHQRTVDGYERTFALNHLAYFLLTNLLLDKLKASAPARIINVSSRAHQMAMLNFDDLQNETQYGIAGERAYGQSKLANLLFTYELARRLEGTGVAVNAMHPGLVATGFGINNGGLMSIGMRVYHLFGLTPEQGADTIIYLASSPEVEGVTGKYWVERKPVRSSQASYDEATQKRLWSVSAEMTGIVAPVQSKS